MTPPAIRKMLLLEISFQVRIRMSFQPGIGIWVGEVAVRPRVICGGGDEGVLPAAFASITCRACFNRSSLVDEAIGRFLTGRIWRRCEITNAGPERSLLTNILIDVRGKLHSPDTGAAAATGFEALGRLLLVSQPVSVAPWLSALPRLAGAHRVFRVLPVEQAGRIQQGVIDAVQAACVHADFVGL